MLRTNKLRTTVAMSSRFCRKLSSDQLQSKQNPLSRTRGGRCTDLGKPSPGHVSCRQIIWHDNIISGWVVTRSGSRTPRIMMLCGDDDVMVWQRRSAPIAPVTDFAVYEDRRELHEQGVIFPPWIILQRRLKIAMEYVFQKLFNAFFFFFSSVSSCQYTANQRV